MLTEGIYIADRYEIIGKIGTGGMSDVFKAMDHVLGRNVAIKVLKTEFAEDVNFVAKFRTEAQSAAGLEHPNIVNIYDVGSENGIHYIVMEYVEGITLKSYIEKKHKLTYKEAASIAIQVGRGIEAAHNKHIVHRDIKPQNIMISSEGKVKVTDFGIARAVNSSTIHTDVMGSVHYASPEQARNGFVDGKSDIYSLGIVMYEMVTGRVPFDGDTTVAVAIQHLQDEMIPPRSFSPELPKSMEKVIQKCTQKNPDRRYENISALLTDLRHVLEHPEDDAFIRIEGPVQEKTRVIATDDLETIRKKAGTVTYTEPERIDLDEEEEDEEEEGILNPKMEKAVTILGIGAAVIIVIIIICIILNLAGVFRFGGGKDKDNQQTTDPVQEQVQEQEQPEENLIEMIDISGKTEEEAREMLKDMGVGLQVIGSTSSEQYEEGQIVNQDPEEGTMIEKNSTVKVTLSSGQGQFEAPDTLNRTEEEAAKIIEDAGLVPKRDYAYSDTVEAGKVVSQTPEPGISVKKGDTVTYYVSRGAETVRVPDVYNKPETEAREIMANAGFVVDATSEYHDTIPEGHVIRQSVSVGEFRTKGTQITIVVSLGKRTEYYSYSVTISKPSADAQLVSAELYMAESDEMIPINVADNGDSISISATNIVNCDRGTLVLKWMEIITEDVLDEEGNVVESNTTENELPLDERNVSFTRQ